MESTPRASDVASRVVRLAELQFGVIAAWQLLACGLSRTGIGRWVAAGRLHRLSPGVYALGHRALSEEGRLSAALLHAGTGAALSHVTAAWWWGLLRFADRKIHVSHPGRTGSTDRVIVHHPRQVDRVWHRGLPVTDAVQTLLDIALMASEPAFRRAMAQADHLGLIQPEALPAVTAGRRGCARLRAALDRHLPELAGTLSPLEDDFLLFCQARGFPIPEPNALIAGFHVDAVFREARLAVELDGRDVHGQPAAVIRDRRREMAIRGAGYRIVRYSDEQINRRGDATAADLSALLRLATTPRYRNAA
jgi:Protein of unknown function (DUF559)/Transcriptional regulator, AbiEi antitoxin